MTEADKIRNRLDSVLEREIALLGEFGGNEEAIRSSIFENDWSGLERMLRACEPIVEAIDNLEKERSGLFDDLKRILREDPSAGFYQVIVRFPHEERERSSTLYRSLKREVLKIQGITWSIDAHVQSVTAVMQQILNEQFPHRKGRLYCRKGNATKPQETAIVFNRSL